jgi:hypothetical protein
MPVHVRPFHRTDRDQVTALVNAHVAAVLPGVTLSVQQVLSQLEREPGEYVVDPWVVDRATLVAEQRGRVTAAAHLLRYGGSAQVGASYRDAGEIRWLLSWPASGQWPDSQVAAEQLMRSCLGQLGRWRVSQWYADASLPVPAVFGVPEQWPHVTQLYRAAGFRASRVETVFLADVADLPAATPPPAGITLRRLLGANGTRFAAALGTDVVGYLEVDTTIDTAPRVSRMGQWADIGNAHLAPGADPRLHEWLLGQAADWLRLAGVTRLLDYADPETPAAYVEALRAHGFRELTRIARGWRLAPAPPATIAGRVT